jgi:putative FmdB family regulatory protein
VPTYAYACKDCGHAFDIHQSFSDDTLTVCPECRGALRKKFNSVGVVFKGSGFYRTDSRSGAGSTVAAAPKAGSSPASSSESGASAAPAAAPSTSSASGSSPAPSPSKTPATVGS